MSAEQEQQVSDMKGQPKQKELLFLVHRIPYPPNKGDKIRSFNMLKHFAKTYRVHLGAFIDDTSDRQYIADVKALCNESGTGTDESEVCMLNLNPLIRRVASLKGLLDGRALTLPYYESRKMQQWVDNTILNRDIDAIIVFSSPMAQFVDKHKKNNLKRVVDFVDVDSDKWRQYSKNKSWPASWIYAREARTLLNYERNISTRFDATVLVSNDEAALFKKLAPEASEKIYGINNGVDTEYFSPERDYNNPYKNTDPVLVFTGAMDYWANVDAVCWFAEVIFPRIKAQVENASFYIVGSHPSNEVLELAKLPGVSVTGAVQDIRPWIAHAKAAVAPMRIARGIQNKVLEAMAMSKPVLATPEAAEGIKAEQGVNLLVESNEKNLAQVAINLLTDDASETGQLARACVLQHYDWSHNLSRFDELLENKPTHNRMCDKPVADVVV